MEIETPRSPGGFLGFIVGVRIMPIYEYRCNSCDFRFELKQGFDAQPVASCPRCQGRATRVFHEVPVFYRGSGFYTTDHRNDNKKEEKKEED